jgi:putative ABC transport system permease protein
LVSEQSKWEAFARATRLLLEPATERGMMTRLFRRFLWSLRSRRKEEELREELLFHLDEEAESARLAGLPEREARLAARRDLGNRARIEEDIRAMWEWPLLRRTRQDLAYAGRLVRRRPAFSATAIITLALGIGGATAVFGILQPLFMQSLPVERPHQLVRLAEASPLIPAGFEAFTLVTTLQRESRLLSDVVASSVSSSRPGEVSIRGARRPAFVQFVSDNYFDGLGVRALIGRVFHQPATGEPVVVISEDYWRREFGADPSAIGTTLRSGRRDFSIAGVAPKGFRGTEIDVPADVWIPFEQVLAPDDDDRVRGRWMRVTGRIGPGVSVEQAEAEASAVLGRKVELRHGATGYSGLRRRLAEPLLLVSVVVALVVLITCANLANLMLSATASRGHEFAVRGAIGASRGRIIAQLMIESLVLSATGGVLALVIARWISSGVLALLPPDVAVAAPNLRFALNPSVLTFVALVCAATCLLFGVAPALRATTRATAVDLKGSGGAAPPAGHGTGRALIVGQVAICMMLLVVAGVFLRTLQNLRGQDAGYREHGLLVADASPPFEYPDDRRDVMLEELRRRIGGLPGVEIAAFSHVGQLSGGAIEFDIRFPEEPETEHPEVIEQRITPGFIGAMGTSLVAGRDFTQLDDARSPLVTIVNESFARRLLPGRNPIGERFFRPLGTRGDEPMEIVGVIRDAKWVNLRDDPPPMYYRPYAQMGGTPTVRFAIRTSGNPEPLGAELAAIARSINREMAVTNVAPFAEIVNRTLAQERLIAHVATGFGLLALTIAAVGLYGILAYAVVRRRREIGVRVAVGARPRSIERLFLSESMVSVGIGVALGLPAAFAVTRLAASMLYGLGPYDVPSAVGAAVVLTLAAGAATYLPARRAATIDPLVALREA